jgi:hypothetical protein
MCNEQTHGSSKAGQQDGLAHAQLDSLLAEGKLLEAALLAGEQQQHFCKASKSSNKLAAGARFAVAVHVDSSAADVLDAAADGQLLLQQQQLEEQQQHAWQVGLKYKYINNFHDWGCHQMQLRPLAGWQALCAACCGCCFALAGQVQQAAVMGSKGAAASSA